MPAISKIRFTNAIYENGGKRYNDEIFIFDGHNGAIILENGGGKTVFIQLALQAILPHTNLSDRKIRDTLSLEGNPCHIAIEWILNERPRRYALTGITLFLNNGKLDSYKYVYEYGSNDDHSIENIPFVRDSINGKKRPASREEMGDYYQYMCRESINAHTFSTIKEYHKYIEENFKIIPLEWRNIGVINGEEGGVEKFFDGCKRTENLVDKLLIPVVEEAMAGDGTEDFVSTFEEQREHFKQHNHLKKSIGESKKIQEKIEDYVDVFNKYNFCIKEYNEEKSYGKALYQYIFNEKEFIKNKLIENKEDQDKYKWELEELYRKEGSYNLACINHKLQIVKDKYQDILKKYEIIKEEFNNKKAKLQNLEIARYKKDIKKLEDEITYYNNQLELLEKDYEVSEIEENLERNSSNINNYYKEKINKLKSEKALLENTRLSYEKELRELINNKENLDKERRKISEEYIRSDEQLKAKDNEIKRIKKEILSNPERENVEEEYPKWSGRVNYIEKYLIDCQEKLTNFKEEKYAINEKLPEHRERLSDFFIEIGSIKKEVENVEYKEKELLINIKELFPNLSHINSIYTKQEQIISTLENRCERIRREKENLLIEERKYYRFIDDYKDNEYFTGEPLLDKWLQEWKNQFNYLETGTEYIERVAKTMGNSEKKYYENYPYWVNSVIVSDKEEEKITKKLESNLEKITHPVIILPQSKAAKVLENGITSDYTCLYPLMWKNNIVKKDFNDKKEELDKEADDLTRKRKTVEAKLKKYDNLLENTVKFLNEYSYFEYLMPLKDELKDIEEKYYITQETINKKNRRIETIDRKVENINNKFNDLTMEKDILNNKIGKAKDYIRNKNYIKNIKKEVFKLKIQLNKKDEEILKLIELIEYEKDKVDELKEKINTCDRITDSLLKDDLYLEVKDYEPKISEISIEVLKRERKDLKELLNEKQKDRSFIEENINERIKIKEKYEKELKNEIKMAEFPIDEELIFPIYGEEEIEQLINDINIITPKVDETKTELDKVYNKYRDIEKEYSLREEDFFKEYNEIVEFTEPLKLVKEKINKEKVELDKKYKYLKSLEEEFNKEYDSIDKVLNILKQKNERYEFLINKIKPSILPENIIIQLPYNREKYINELLKNLENLNYEVENREEMVSREKTKFETYCYQFVKNPRLKNMAISGINHKENYEDLIKWKKIIDKRINNTIKILEEDMMEHDKQINQFIGHLHSYLKTIGEEIRNIPKKTRIKVDDNWKEIYIIDVPTWVEELGEEKLREYINWLLDDIEDIRFKDGEGKEDKALVRKYMEDKFQSKNLLKVVMGNEKIKVRCRKVTNDGKINSRPVSWEQSNRWSGGERWSKNMTLFLGILNYLAEKRQNIAYSKNRDRTVILDNPFGEASSDHVLDPVFFIAEQLGFQIIALTAHSEGKYIRDFFPVVYSCRLRQAIDQETLIFTKEKEINYAYFKDKEPQVLLRLGDVEQLNMI